MYLVGRHTPRSLTGCWLDTTLGIDLLHLVEAHNSSTDGSSAAFQKLLMDDGVKTRNLVTAFVSMTSPCPTHEYEELMKKCQEATMQVSLLLQRLPATQSRY